MNRLDEDGVKWEFPHGVNLTISGHNNQGIEIFLDKIAQSLSREIIQNSLDVHNSEVDSAVKVKFQFMSILKEDIPDRSVLEEALKDARTMWKEKDSKDTLDYLDRFESTLNKPEISVLKISDFNTVGLKKINFDTLINEINHSKKDDIDSAGSKGIGKAAPFAASDLRMVFYSSLTAENESVSAGVMNFVSFFKDKLINDITQERVMYYNGEKRKIDRQFSFDGDERIDEYGTDIYIVGLKDNIQWRSEILLSTINNFLVSIVNNNLEVEIDGVILNSQTLDERMNEIDAMDLDGEKKREFSKTKLFLDVLKSEDTIEVDLDERFNRYTFINQSSDGKLLLKGHELGTRTILQTRQSGMSIYERSSISGTIQFTGVFQALGREFNEFLKDMENANHNSWSVDRVSGEINQLGKNLLHDLFHFYKDNVIHYFGTETTDEVDAFGVRDLLPLYSNTDGSEIQKDSGLTSAFSSVGLKTNNRNNQYKQESSSDKETSDAISDLGIDEGDTSDQGSSREGIGGGNNPDQDFAPGLDSGDKGESEESDNRVVGSAKRNVMSSDFFKYKVECIDELTGEYRIIGSTKKSIQECHIELKSVSADGRTSPLQIRLVKSSTNITSFRRNYVIIKDLVENERINITFVIEDKFKVKMEGLLYEIKA